VRLSRKPEAPAACAPKGGADDEAVGAWPGGERAAKQLGAFAHAEDAVAADSVCRRARDPVRDRQLELLVAVIDPYLGSAVPVAGGVGQRLLEDSVGGLVKPRSEWSLLALDPDLGLEAVGSVTVGQRVRGRQPDRRFDVAAALPQPTDHPLDLTDCLAGDRLRSSSALCGPPPGRAVGASARHRPGQGSR